MALTMSPKGSRIWQDTLTWPTTVAGSCGSPLIIAVVELLVCGLFRVLKHTGVGAVLPAPRLVLITLFPIHLLISLEAMNELRNSSKSIFCFLDEAVERFAEVVTEPSLEELGRFLVTELVFDEKALRCCDASDKCERMLEETKGRLIFCRAVP